MVQLCGHGQDQGMLLVMLSCCLYMFGTFGTQSRILLLYSILKALLMQKKVGMLMVRGFFFFFYQDKLSILFLK